MKITSRAAIYAAFGVGPLLLAAGCGGENGTAAEGTLARIQPTSFVEVAPATTTTTTVAPTDTTPGRIPGEQQYTIRGGDTLGRIASRYDITLDQLIAYNQFANGSNQLILPGDVIKIPPGASNPSAVEEAAGSGDTGGDTGASGDTSDDSSDTASDGEGCSHTIAAGEFPNKVARQYGITYEQLQAANPSMDMTTTFVVGDTVKIPPEGDCG